MFSSVQDESVFVAIAVAEFAADDDDDASRSIEVMIMGAGEEFLVPISQYSSDDAANWHCWQRSSYFVGPGQVRGSLDQVKNKYLLANCPLCDC